MIYERTKAATLPRRGDAIGQLRGLQRAGHVKANARQFAANVLPIIEEIERSGVTSYNATAAKLNERTARAQLRPQIVPWSTLCRADWVRND
jgi:hypothetical protein